MHYRNLLLTRFSTSALCLMAYCIMPLSVIVYDNARPIRAGLSKTIKWETTDDLFLCYSIKKLTIHQSNGGEGENGDIDGTN